MMNDLYRRDILHAAEDADFLRGRRALITGATGLLGSFLAETMLAAGAQVIAAGRSEDRVRQRFGDRVTFAPYDAARPLQFDPDADFIVHAACSAHPIAYASDPVGIMQANLLGVMNLLEAMRKRPETRLVFLSTGEIYGENPDLPEGFSEGDHGYVDSMRPRSCYPESKRAAETLCACYAAQHGAQAVVARLCHVYGPTFTASNSRADAQFIRNALHGQDIVMKSTGAQVRSWCYVADAVRAILTLLHRGGAGQAYNVANRNAVASIRQYAQTLADIAGVKLRFEIPPEAEAAGYTRVTRAVLNPAKLEALGWRAEYDLETGLRHTFLCARE